MAADADSEVAKKRDDLKKELTPQQFAAAQKRASEVRSQIEAKIKAHL